MPQYSQSSLSGPSQPPRPANPEKMPTVTSTVVRRVAAVMLAVAGILHLVLVPEYLAEKPWLGILFVVAAVLTVGAAGWLWWRPSVSAWLVGAAVSAGMIVGFILSRTVGLLGYVSSDWAEGIPSLLVEAVFLIIAAVQLPALIRGRRTDRGPT